MTFVRTGAWRVGGSSSISGFVKNYMGLLKRLARAEGYRNATSPLRPSKCNVPVTVAAHAASALFTEVSGLTWR